MFPITHISPLPPLYPHKVGMCDFTYLAFSLELSGSYAAKSLGKSTRIGVYKCKDCRKPFTVKVGTIFEDSHIPMRIWLQRSPCFAPARKA